MGTGDLTLHWERRHAEGTLEEIAGSTSLHHELRSTSQPL